MEQPVVIEEMKDVPFYEITRLNCEDEMLKFQAPVLGKGATAIIPMMHGASLIAFSGTPEQTYQLRYSQYYVGKVLVNLTMSGKVTHVLDTNKVSVPVKRNQSFIYSVDNDCSYMSHSAAVSFEVASLIFDPSVFESVLDRFFGPDDYASKQACLAAVFTKESHGKVFTFNHEVKQVVRQILRCRLTGNFRRVYLECKLFELLAHYFASIMDGRHNRITFSARDVAILQEVKRALTNEDLTKVSVDELCKQFGINRFKLTMGFQSVFNTSIIRYFRQQVLSRAHQTLADGVYNVSQAAFVFGYANAAAFSRAFFKEFGMRPGEVARIRSQPDSSPPPPNFRLHR
jgi:AraC-type DNA-binding domain-containing proteins